MFKNKIIVAIIELFAALVVNVTTVLVLVYFYDYAIWAYKANRTWALTGLPFFVGHLSLVIGFAIIIFFTALDIVATLKYYKQNFMR